MSKIDEKMTNIHSKPYTVQKTLNNSTKVTLKRLKVRDEILSSKKYDNSMNSGKRNQTLRNESEFEN